MESLLTTKANGKRKRTDSRDVALRRANVLLEVSRRCAAMTTLDDCMPSVVSRKNTMSTSLCTEGRLGYDFTGFTFAKSSNFFLSGGFTHAAGFSTGVVDGSKQWQFKSETR